MQSIECPLCWIEAHIGNPNGENPGPTRYVRRGQTLPGRQMWLLETMCQRMGIDTMLIDPTIDYWENKAEIERQAHTRLYLTSTGEMAAEARKMGSLLAEEKREEVEALASYMQAREHALGKNH